MCRCEAVEATMKKLEDSSEVHVDASYTHDPSLKSQGNGLKKKQFKVPMKSKTIATHLKGPSK